MKTAHVLLVTTVILTFFCSGCNSKNATSREKSLLNPSEKSTYSKFAVRNVIDQCRHREQQPKQLEEWPKKYFGPAFIIKTERPVESTSEFREILNERPESLKQNHVVKDIIDRKGWFIAVFKNNPPTQSRTIMRAYAVKKESSTICYWINW